MSLLYGYATGSTTESRRYDAIDNLLDKLPDNNLNLIKAEDVRDSVFTLWERIGEVSTIVNNVASASATFINPNPTTVTVGGIPAGSSFPTEQTVQSMFNQLLYPYTRPVLSLSTLSNKEYGQSPIANISWSVNKKSNDITNINIAGISIVANGGSQSGNQLVTGSYSINPGVSTINTFTMSVTDTSPTTTSISTTLTWMNKVYWGSIDLTGMSYPNPNLTLEPVYTTQVGNFITDAKIKTLNSALSTTKSLTLNGINGNGNYLVFAWPSNVSGATTPTFKVNGLNNSAFTRIRTASPFTNSQTTPFTTNYEVWVSNTQYNSPVDLIIS